MIISESTGTLEGFSFKDGELYILGTLFADNKELDVVAPFNVNRPKKFSFGDYANKKFKLTIELL